MSNFSQCLAITLKWEGGYSNHPADPGGATNMGITQKVYNEWLTKKSRAPQSVRSLSREERDAIYYENYWQPLNCDDLPKGVDLAVFDAGVNSGITRAARWLKQAQSAPITTIKTLCDLRLSFVQSLKIFAVFGKGWTRRIADIRARAILMASNIQTLQEEAQQRLQQSQKNTTASRLCTGGGAGAGGISITLPTGMAIVLALIALGLIAFALHQAWKAKLHRTLFEATQNLINERGQKT